LCDWHIRSARRRWTAAASGGENRNRDHAPTPQSADDWQSNRFPARFHDCTSILALPPNADIDKRDGLFPNYLFVFKYALA
jgi:hypothetical protein